MKFGNILLRNKKAVVNTGESIVKKIKNGDINSVIEW